MPLRRFVDILDEVYQTYHHRRFVSPDPLEVLYGYDDPADQEVVGFVAASLAYGRVAQILVSVRRVLAVLGERPRRFLADTSPSRLERALGGFRHRFNTGSEMAAMMSGLRTLLARQGSVESAMARHIAPGDRTVVPALSALTAELHELAGGPWNHLLSDVSKGGACKRLHLYLRWMCRRDGVDVGAWRSVPPALLVVPLDTHMHRLCRSLGATSRNAADARAAIEATNAFAAISPDDPVRYDFSLTRLGIRRELDAQEFAEYFGRKKDR